MKVRHKDKSKIATFTVIEEAPTYYIALYDGCFKATILLSKCDFEPVPDERWEDVTAACEFKAARMMLSHKDTEIITGDYCGGHWLELDYRLVKVRVAMEPGKFIELPLTYFRVEKRVP